MSLHELRDKNHDYQKNTRLLTDDIIDGRDELGLSFFLETSSLPIADAHALARG